MGEEAKGAATIGGAPISWVALMGALLGGGTIIPIIYYIEGGGFHSLTYTLIALNGAILGPWGGGVAALIAGLIGLFISPGTPWTAVIFDLTLPAIMCGLIAARKWKWIFWIPLVNLAILEVFPWYTGGYPGMGPIPQPFLALAPWYDALSFPLILIFGAKIPEWLRSDSRKEIFAGLWLLHWTGAQMWHLGPAWGLWLTTVYPVPAFVYATLEAFAVPFERVMLQFLQSVIGVPILMALRKSGLRRIPGAAW